jgi:hypothetical protein
MSCCLLLCLTWVDPEAWRASCKGWRTLSRLLMAPQAASRCLARPWADQVLEPNLTKPIIAVQSLSQIGPFGDGTHTYGYLKTDCFSLEHEVAGTRQEARIVMRRDRKTRQIGTSIAGVALLASCTFILGACAKSPTEAKTLAASPPSTGYDAGGYTIVITPPTGP